MLSKNYNYCVIIGILNGFSITHKYAHSGKEQYKMRHNIFDLNKN